MEISRRTFLSWSAAAGVGLPAGGLDRLAVPAKGAAPEPRPICVFSKHLQWLDYEALAEVVAETGFDGLDLTVRPGGHVLPERVTEDLPRAVEAARRAGLVVPMMTTGITSTESPHAEAVLRTAQQVGIRYYRMGSLSYRAEQPVAQTLEALRPAMAALADLNRRHAIHGSYQNHAGVRVGGPVWDIAFLLQGLDPEWIGCQYDIRHATVEGGTAWPLGLRLLSPYIRTTDIKDFLWEKQGTRWRPRTVPLGEGMVDFAGYFRLLKALEIGGPISMHYEYAPLEGRNDLPAPQRRRQAVELMRADLERLRSLMRGAEL